MKKLSYRVTKYCYCLILLLSMVQLALVVLQVSSGELLFLSIAPVFLSSLMFLHFKIPPMVVNLQPPLPKVMLHYIVRLTCVYFVVSLGLQLVNIQRFVLVWFMLYVVLILGMSIYFKVKQQVALYQTKTGEKAAIVVHLITLVSILTLVALFLGVCACFGLVNNTIEIMLVGLILIVNVILIVVNSMLEEQYVRKEKLESYQPSKRQLKMWIVEVLLVLLMIGVAWFTQGF